MLVHSIERTRAEKQSGIGTKKKKNDDICRMRYKHFFLHFNIILLLHRLLLIRPESKYRKHESHFNFVLRFVCVFVCLCVFVVCFRRESSHRNRQHCVAQLMVKSDPMEKAKYSKQINKYLGLGGIAWVALVEAPGSRFLVAYHSQAHFAYIQRMTALRLPISQRVDHWAMSIVAVHSNPSSMNALSQPKCIHSANDTK